MMRRDKSANSKRRTVVRLSAAEPPKPSEPFGEDRIAAPSTIQQAPLPQKEDGFSFAYLCERLPAFVQTFVYREIEQMAHLGMKPFTVSIRRPDDPPELAVTMETPVFYLPEGAEIRTKIDKDRELGRLHSKLHRAIPKHRSEGDSQRMFEAAWLGPILEAAGIRHVHAHFGGMAARTAWWLRKLFGITYSFTGHANDIFCENSYPTTNTMLVKDAKFVVTETDFSRAWMTNKYPFARRKIFRVYNGIRMDGLPVAQPAKGIPRIVSVGRYVEKKGYPDLVEACALLRDRGCVFECQIIGGGELDGQIAEQIARLNLGDCVKLLGPRSQAEVRERIATARVFVLACQTEKDGGSDNLPTVIMEAMAIGVPCVSTKVAGVPEMITDGETGILTAERNVKGIANALEKLLRNEALAAQFGELSAKRAREKFTVQGSALELAQILVRHAPVDAPAALVEVNAALKLGFWRRVMR